MIFLPGRKISAFKEKTVSPGSNHFSLKSGKGQERERILVSVTIVDPLSLCRGVTCRLLTVLILLYYPARDQMALSPCKRSNGRERSGCGSESASHWSGLQLPFPAMRPTPSSSLRLPQPSSPLWLPVQGRL